MKVLPDPKPGYGSPLPSPTMISGDAKRVLLLSCASTALLIGAHWMRESPIAPTDAIADAGSSGVTCLASIDVNGAFWQQCNDDNGNILWRDINGRTYAECPPVICTEAAQ